MRRGTAIQIVLISLLNAAAVSAYAQGIFMDSFELCRVANVVEWDGGGDGVNWSDPLNWADDAVPVNGDAVAIRLDATHTVTYDAPTTTLSCLGVTSNLSLVPNTTLILDGPATVTADLAMGGGVLTVNAQMTVQGEFLLSLGSIQGSGRLTINGPFTWTGGSQLGTGETIVNGATLVSGANTNNLSERTLTLNGPGAFAGSADWVFRWGAVLNINAPFDITTDADLTYIQGNVPTVNVNSSLTKSAGAGRTAINSKVNNNGSIAVDSGELELGDANSSGASTGAFTVASGATLRVLGGHTFDAASSLTGTGGFVFDGQGQLGTMLGNYALTGPVTVEGGTLQFPARPILPNTVTLAGGDLDLPAGADMSGPVTLESGDLIAGGPVMVTGELQQLPLGGIDGAGTVTVDGLFTWTGGSQRGAGETIANGDISISGANFKTLSERTLTLNGAGAFGGSADLQFRWGAVLNINAPFDITTDADLTYIQGNVPTVNVNSSLTKSAGAGTTGIFPDVVNSGSIDVSTGQLGFQRVYTQTETGSLQVNLSGDAQFDVFAVVSTANLGGTLIINLAGGYEPSVGQTFEILTTPLRVEEFATVSGTEIVPGREFQVVYGANGVTLEVVEP